MEVSKGKISIRQGLLLIILALGAPSLRVIPNYISRYSGKASWVAPIISIIPGIILILILAKLFSKDKDGSLYEVYQKIFGKIISKIIIVIYGIWCIALASLYLRIYGERILGTVLFNANLTMILAVMAIVVYFVVNQRVDVIGRIGEALIIFLLFVFFIVFILVIPDMKLSNIYPVTYYDGLPVLRGTLPIISLISYITVVMIFGEKISNKECLKKSGVKIILFQIILFFMLILTTVGVFGYRINTQFLFPYFITLKSIEILDSFERVESLFISIWIASDFAIITLFSFASLNLTQKIFNKKDYKKLPIIIMIIIYFIALNLAENVYYIEILTMRVVAPINIILFFVLPIIALIVGKCRKVV